MSLPREIQRAVEVILSDYTGNPVHILSSSSRGGGCIHNATHLNTDAGSFFIKWNSADQLDNYKAETHGLSLLKTAESCVIPEVITSGSTEKYAWLLMEYIEEGPRSLSFFTEFGNQLAALHRNTHEQFGLDRNNYIGSLPQVNTFENNWPTFFAKHRLGFQVKLGQQNGFFAPPTLKQFEQLYSMLPDLMPDEPASLLHGDLWSGNFMVGADGSPVLIDPAVFYGHREAEIAFTQLFGGFGPGFYDAYQEAWPLTPGWQERVGLFNLYPLTVHLNLFGRSYLPQIQSILNRYV